ncbi:MAG TPA: heme-binding domain-containing protein [Thermoanaerobaculia bacterium]
MKTLFKYILSSLALIFVAAQFVRPSFSNPPVNPAHELRAPAQVQSILDRSCNDCHSNRTKYPWYSQITPVSWWLKDHIDEGRGELNLSEFGTYEPKKAAHKLEEVCEMVEKGEMPLREYVWGHPSAKLSEADRQTLCGWAKAERARILGL